MDLVDNKKLATMLGKVIRSVEKPRAEQFIKIVAQT
jgi:hypothetical protein